VKKIPSQFYIFVIVLLCYHWHWYLSLFDPDGDALLTVLLLQSAVITCNILIKEYWSSAIIIIEAASMLFNVTLFLVPAIIADYHAQIMLAAFIIELLIITISMQGAAIGRSVEHSVPFSASGLWANRSIVFNMGRRSEAHQ
jgi:hypothetical protein